MDWIVFGLLALDVLADLALLWTCSREPWPHWRAGVGHEDAATKEVPMT